MTDRLTAADMFFLRELAICSKSDSALVHLLDYVERLRATLNHLLPGVQDDNAKIAICELLREGQPGLSREEIRADRRQELKDDGWDGEGGG